MEGQPKDNEKNCLKLSIDLLDYHSFHHSKTNISEDFPSFFSGFKMGHRGEKYKIFLPSLLLAVLEVCPSSSSFHDRGANPGL